MARRLGRPLLMVYVTSPGVYCEPLTGQVVGLLRDATGNYSLALVVVGVMGIAAAALLPFAGAPVRAAQLRRAAAE